MSEILTGIPPGMTEDDIRSMAGTRDPETPEPWEQEQYDQVMDMFLSFIDGEGTDQTVINTINREGANASEAVGRTTAQIAYAISDLAKGRGNEISPDVMYGAGQEMVESLMEKAQQLGVIDLDPESEEYQSALDMAFLEATKQYGERLMGEPDYPEIQKAAEDHYLHQVAKEADAGEGEEIRGYDALTHPVQAKAQRGQKLAGAIRDILGGDNNGQ